MSVTLEGPARALLDAPNHIHLSVPRRDGTILVAVMWATTDDAGNIVVNSAEGRTWPRLLRNAGHATVSVHNPERPYEVVVAECDLQGDTHDGADAVIDALAHKYMGVEKYPFAEDGEQRVTFTLRPVRVTYRSGG